MIKSRRMKWAGMWHLWGTGELRTGFCWEHPKEIYHLKDIGVDGRIIRKCIFKKWDGEAWTGLFWLRIGTGGGRY
jgi:hypothetical protein